MKSTDREKRLAAEREIDQREASSPEEVPDDRTELVHELRVHQIELEMQNDELEQSHVQLQRLQEEYQELFYDAPVPYFIFDRAGQVVTANNAATQLLNTTHKQLEKKPFITFLPPAYHTAFFDHIRHVFNTDTDTDSAATNRIAVELELRPRSGGNGFPSRVAGVRVCGKPRPYPPRRTAGVPFGGV